MTIASYVDFSYRRDAQGTYADQAFLIFLGEVAEQVGGMVLVGRLDPEPGRWPYRLTEGLEFCALPFYATLASPVAAARALGGSTRRFWGVLGRVDGVLLFGPHPLSLAFAGLALLRRKRLVLGVRQDLPAYVRTRHPSRRLLHAASWALELAYRILALRAAVVVVGPELSRKYARAARRLEMTASLVREVDSVRGAEHERSYAGDLQLLSVGRLDAEKNPLLLADILAELRRDDPRWRLVVCGEGPLAGELAARLEALGVADAAELRGYVAIDGGLLDVYRDSHVFAHVSWTEGVPQVLFEAFATGLPVVATAVGGVPEAAGSRALLVPPGDAAALAAAAREIAGDPGLRGRLIAAGGEEAGRHTLEREAARVATFLDVS